MEHENKFHFNFGSTGKLKVSHSKIKCQAFPKLLTKHTITAGQPETSKKQTEIYRSEDEKGNPQLKAKPPVDMAESSSFHHSSSTSKLFFRRRKFCVGASEIILMEWNDKEIRLQNEN